jgi:tetratricopeptide (TPR) repeat protein
VILMRTAAIGIFVVTLGVARAGAQAETSPSVLLLQEWIKAVEHHVPGALDEWVQTIAQLKYADRSHLDPVMTTFLKLGVLQSRQELALTRDGAQRRVSELARQVAQSPGWGPFLKRAAILHADAAIWRYNAGGFDDPTMPPVRATPPGTRMIGRAPTLPVPPLLTNLRFVASRDGQVIGETPADWNWPFARSLIAQLFVIDAAGLHEAFAAEWYHATTAFMLRNGLYPETIMHLNRGLEIFPGDARLRFDRGCYAELLGLPMQQILRVERPDQRMEIPSRDVTNAEAETWFLRALEVDSAFAEARVRLARLQDLAGRHEAALAGIERALTSNPREVTRYYAHLFAGRAAQALGRLDDARQHYKEAAAVFPDAQSALLAESQAALLAGDLTAALASTKPLGESTAPITADPWWSYHFGAGRDITDLFAALWAHTSR